jgi:hypothetical protein
MIFMRLREAKLWGAGNSEETTNHTNYTNKQIQYNLFASVSVIRVIRG